jgi:hypothetical protein
MSSTSDPLHNEGPSQPSGIKDELITDLQDARPEYAVEDHEFFARLDAYIQYRARGKDAKASDSTGVL